MTTGSLIDLSGENAVMVIDTDPTSVTYNTVIGTFSRV